MTCSIAGSLGGSGVIHTQDELVDETELDQLDELEPVDEAADGLMEDRKEVLGKKGIAESNASGQKLDASTRRLLEQRLDDYKLQHDLDDYYDVKI